MKNALIAAAALIALPVVVWAASDNPGNIGGINRGHIKYMLQQNDVGPQIAYDILFQQKQDHGIVGLGLIAAASDKHDVIMVQEPADPWQGLFKQMARGSSKNEPSTTKVGDGTLLGGHSGGIITAAVGMKDTWHDGYRDRVKNHLADNGSQLGAPTIIRDWANPESRNL